MSRDDDDDDRPRPPAKRRPPPPPVDEDEEEERPRPPAKRRPPADEDEDDDGDDDRRPPKKAGPVAFDGGAGSYVVTHILAQLLTMTFFGIPWAVCMVLTWGVDHTIVEGKRLRFLGTGGQLFGQWIKWVLLVIVTLGIYSFWVVPAFNKWIADNTEFERD